MTHDSVRKLPCQCGELIDAAKQLPPNHVAFNPSRAGKYIYIRITVHAAENEINHALVVDTVTGVARMIESPMTKLQKTVNLFRGIEDLRMVEYDNRIWFAGTCTHASEHQINDLIVGYFNKEMTAVERIEAVEIGSRPVKNMCPFVHHGKLCLFDMFLMKIYELVETEDKKLEVIVFKTLTRGNGISDEVLRGSTSPIHLGGNRWGCVAHCIIYCKNRVLVTRLSYIHHWVEFDIDNGVITYISEPFFLGHWGIEYISGIHRENEKIHLYYGVQDQKALVAITTLADLRSGF